VLTPAGAADLIAFLRARLDEDEAVAHAAFAGPWRYNPRKQWHGLTGDPLRPTTPGEEYVAAGPLDAPVCVAATGPADELQAMADAAHIARWDPARVLAEIEASRRILDLHSPRMGLCDTCAMATVPVYPTPCPTLGALVSAYRDHPGYDLSWTPDAKDPAPPSG
jgi:hypothetical protein